jgi:hypothetical protein
MKKHRFVLVFSFGILLLLKAESWVYAQTFECSIPPEDERLITYQSAKSVYSPPKADSRAEWLARVPQLRQHVLNSMGLWPLPEKTPLNTRISGRIERSGYSVEKVYFESVPGLFVVGNLYRPLGKKGPYPGILSAHGHWKNGRLEDDPHLASVPGRAINLALQGNVVFSYSMLGYNEGALQMEHRWRGKREELWGISIAGIQLWNSIRALDFLTSLSDVDPHRIGMTGASGGATQTFLLAAVDERVKVVVPVNMLSHVFQGGCVCENAPGLRIGISNLDIAGLIAPRPLLMISCTGDWTEHTPRMEYPAMRRLYALFLRENLEPNYDTPEQIQYIQVREEHNYNKESREAAYTFFARWLQNQPQTVVREVPFQVEKPEDLTVFKSMPPGGLNRAQLTEWLINRAKQTLQAVPHDWTGLLQYRELWGSFWKDLLGSEVPAPAAVNVVLTEEKVLGKLLLSRYYLGRCGEQERIPAMLIRPLETPAAGAVLVAEGEGLATQVSDFQILPGSLAAHLADQNLVVLIIDPYPARGKDRRPPDLSHFTTYNRTAAALAIQDILTGKAALQRLSGFSQCRLAGLHGAGLASLLAATLSPDFSRITADAQGLDNRSDDQWVDKAFLPLIRKAGDLPTAASLIAPRPLLIFNTAQGFDPSALKRMYQAAAADRLLSISDKVEPVEVLAKLLD